MVVRYARLAGAKRRRQIFPDSSKRHFLVYKVALLKANQFWILVSHKLFLLDRQQMTRAANFARNDTGAGGY